MTKAIKVVEDSMRPASKNQIESWLIELSVITKRRKESDAVEDLMLAAYRSRLQAYPAKVTHEVLIARTYHFWPSWDELKAVCEDLVLNQRTILFGLRKLAMQTPPVVE